MIPTPGSLQTSLPSALTVIKPTLSQMPFLWLNETSVRLLPGSGTCFVAGSGRFGKHTGAGRSKLSAPSVWTVITSAVSIPDGNGPGSRSGGTGARPTLPPRTPLAAKSAFAGTVIETPASAGFASTTEDGIEMVVSLLGLTDLSVS